MCFMFVSIGALFMVLGFVLMSVMLFVDFCVNASGDHVVETYSSMCLVMAVCCEYRFLMFPSCILTVFFIVDVMGW